MDVNLGEPIHPMTTFSSYEALYSNKQDEDRIHQILLCLEIVDRRYVANGNNYYCRSSSHMSIILNGFHLFTINIDLFNYFSWILV